MAFNANNFIIDKVRRVTEVALDTGLVNWTVVSVENPQVEFTGESTEKRDAYGVLLAKFDTAKGVNFSGEGSMLSMPMMAAQLGTDVEVASETAKLKGKTFEVLKVVEGKATMTYTPVVAPTHVYGMTADKNIDTAMAVGTDGPTVADKVITMPESYKGTMVGVLYEYETTSAVKVVDSAEKFAEAAQYIVDILAADVCNPSVKRAGSLVFPKAKIDNNFSVGLTAEGTHPFAFSALKDYCSDDAELCYLIFNE